MKKKETELQKLERRIKALEHNILVPRPQVAILGPQGEWCPACGAWKTYGVTDRHYCTGYRITC